MPTELIKHPQDQEVTLLDFFKLFWAAKLNIFIVSTLFFIGSVYQALVTEEVYTSYSLLKYVEKESADDSGIESMLNLRQNNRESFGLSMQQSVTYLQSREVIYKFFDEYNVREHLFEEAWDEQSQSWVDLTDVTVREWKAYETYLRDHLKVRLDPQTKLINLSIVDRSPEKTVFFIKGLIKTANKSAKDKFLSDTEKKIEIFKSSYKEYEDLYSKDFLMTLIKKETAKKVSVENNDNFLFEFVDYPVIPEQRSAPNRTLMVLIGTGSGFLLSLLLILAIELFRERE